MEERLPRRLEELSNLYGVSGDEGRVRRYLKDRLAGLEGLTMKTDTMGTDQNFIIGTRKGYTGYYMMVTANVNYAVNRSDNGGRAIIWPLSTGSADSRLADNSESVIRLYTSRELLTAREPVGDWSTVYFGGSGISVWVRVH